MPTILAHELLLGVGQVGAGGGATSPTTSVGGGGIGSMNAAVAPLGNICNTLPHAPCSTAGMASGGAAASSSLAGLSNNLPLNRNLVMLRNHLRKNTTGSAVQTPLHDDKDQ